MKDKTTRRELFRKAGTLGTGLAVYLAIPQRAAAAPTISKADARYQNHPDNGHRCAHCCMFIPSGKDNQSGACTMVKGSISPNGWCKYWTFGPNDTCS